MAYPRYSQNITFIDLILSRVVPIGDALAIVKTVRNWHQLVLFRLGIKKEITVTVRSGKKYKISSDLDYFRFMHRTKIWALELAREMPEIQIRKNAVRVKKFGKTILLGYDSPSGLGSALGLAIEQLVGEQYKKLQVENRDVVDIGASIADTPIYFALRGAKHVYAFEPFPKMYETARKNIALNRLEDKISLANAALGGKKGSIRVERGGELRTGVFLKEGIARGGKKVEVLTLNDIANRCGINHGILKLDCEGCEYSSILRASDSTLANFDQIMIEYHFGYLDLEKRLREAGFKVSHTWPKSSGYDDPYSKMYLGLVFATRI